VKVTGARTTLFQGELSRALGDSNLPGGTSRTAGAALVLETDEGLTGLALASPASVPSIEFLLPIVVGEDPGGRGPSGRAGRPGFQRRVVGRRPMPSRPLTLPCGT
jgi:hypothetical protein